MLGTEKIRYPIGHFQTGRPSKRERKREREKEKEGRGGGEKRGLLLDLGGCNGVAAS